MACDADVAGTERASSARNLIRWCLQGDAAARPTMDQVCAHPFLCEGGVPAAAGQLRMCYHAFLSHFQVEASGTERGWVARESKHRLVFLIRCQHAPAFCAQYTAYCFVNPAHDAT